MVKEGKAERIPTPINIIWENILMISIVGVIDSKQAQGLMNTMLQKISETEAKVIILDILGVATIDTAVVGYLVNITKATKLMGCECIISGISPSVAQSLVHLGVGLGDVTTKAALKDALELAFEKLSLEIREAPKKKAA